MATKLKLYTDRSFIPKGKQYLPLLYPMWGFIKEKAGSLDFDRFEDYATNGHHLIEIVSPQAADAFLYPVEWESDCQEVRVMELLAKNYGKKLIVFHNSDLDYEIPLENALIFRTSLYASKRKPNEFAVPGWSRDFGRSYLKGEIPLRNKQEVPIIGYAGYLDDYNILRLITKFVRRIRTWSPKIHIGAHLRGKAIGLLSNNRHIRTNFILRNMSGSAMDRMLSKKKKEAYRLEYVQNIINSDYTLVIRGGGNFSYRLYEVLSCGRIPLFINTDCVLPFNHIVDWKKYMIWVELSEIGLLAEKVIDFHASLSDKDFRDLQMNARILYEKMICPTGFYSNIWRCLPDSINHKSIGLDELLR